MLEHNCYMYITYISQREFGFLKILHNVLLFHFNL